MTNCSRRSGQPVERGREALDAPGAAARTPGVGTVAHGRDSSTGPRAQRFPSVSRISATRVSPRSAASRTQTVPCSSPGQATTVWPVPSEPRTSRRLAGLPPTRGVGRHVLLRPPGLPGTGLVELEHEARVQALALEDGHGQPARRAGLPGRAGEPHLVEPPLRERAQPLGRAVATRVHRVGGCAVKVSRAGGPPGPGRRPGAGPRPDRARMGRRSPRLPTAPHAASSAQTASRPIESREVNGRGGIGAERTGSGDDHAAVGVAAPWTRRRRMRHPP